MALSVALFIKVIQMFAYLFYDFFQQANTDYEYFGTNMDGKKELDDVTDQKMVQISLVAAQVAGQMALRLVHDHILKLDVTTYGNVITNHVSTIISRVNSLKSDKVMFFVICMMFLLCWFTWTSF